MRVVLIAIFLANYLFAVVTVVPKIITLDDVPSDMVNKAGAIYASLSNGEIVSIDANRRVKKLLILPKAQNYNGEKVNQRALSVALSSSAKLIAVASDSGGIYIFNGKNIIKTAFNTKTVIRKIAFVSEDTILVALLSSEIVKFDLKTNKIVSVVSTGTSALSDMAISPDLKIAYSAGEAGIVTLINTETMQITSRFQGGNVDNIYRLDSQNFLTITAGQDRRSVLYGKNGTILKRWDGSFLIYAAALSPNGSRAAIAMDEQNNITVVNTIDGSVKYIAKGHTTSLNRIVFLSEDTFASCADENKIYIWRIK